MVMDSNLYSQSSGSKHEANEFFDAGQYRSALRSYRQAGLDHSTDKKIQLRVGICLYEINDIDSAIPIFQGLIDEGKTDADVFLYMGKCYQSKNIYPQSTSFYKSFIEKSKPDHPQYQWAKDELTRCANGARLKFGDEEAYVENAGTGINTQYDEYDVKPSPTSSDKIYFTSNRTTNTSSEVVNANTDIYSVSLINGNWTTPSPLPASINTPAYEEACGFSKDGQILYYLGSDRNVFRIKTDTFSYEEGIVYQGIFNGPYRADGGGADLTFFNDSICLFSSDALGGYGGYDLYISILQNGNWSTPANLGSTINSFYNERYPFLTKNGQTLFFSSDNLESMGGYDVFRTVFNPDLLTWALPENLGFPINSSLDDTHMVLTSDGMAGYVSSNRKTGYGGIDIYRVFFKQPVRANQQISIVPTFYQLLLLKGPDQVSTDQPYQPPEKKEYFISHLFIDENGEILTPQNIKKLDLLANLMIIYPHISAELSGFELPSDHKTFNLYFSIKKVEDAADYLVKKGVPRNRLVLKGYGSSFPLVLNLPDHPNSPVFMKLNHRMEIGLHYYESEPVITHLENIPVPENLHDPRGDKFSFLRHDLYYSIQIASVHQILQNPSLDSLDEMFIEVDNSQGNYMYMSGMLLSFQEADGRLKDMISIGFPDAFIVPYIDGLRIKKEDVPGLAPQYPDLMNYYEKMNK